VVVVTTPHVVITTLEIIQLVNQQELHHLRHRHLRHLLLVVAHFNILMLNTERHAVKLYQLQLQLAANLLLAQVLLHHRLHHRLLLLLVPVNM
jgi:hydroxyacyl-ACP dehydratase HTD2-like protein with hotdog domain